ncbi:hypothetical protein F9288_09450 [Sphingomonas sp. CL5.1]|uniref:hypothetical protein n=1 Tax=Sphingomonas sp. CL5.1 TaxID=2653203 RepID=UPI0015836DC6|nr:hypothetical protein [Sphingomonas sp. CL5.1]QKR99835.1 hypothetical protein F9288_09450 [Sphingomonas sp. CL5.1]
MASYLLCIIAGAALFNALPHLLSGMNGRTFPTPFANPPGKGQSSAKANVLWGFANLIAAYAAGRAGGFSISDIASLSSSAVGALLLSLYLSHHFSSLGSGT